MSNINKNIDLEKVTNRYLQSGDIVIDKEHGYVFNIFDTVDNEIVCGKVQSRIFATDIAMTYHAFKFPEEMKPGHYMAIPCILREYNPARATMYRLKNNVNLCTTFLENISCAFASYNIFKNIITKQAEVYTEMGLHSHVFEANKTIYLYVEPGKDSIDYSNREFDTLLDLLKCFHEILITLSKFHEKGLYNMDFKNSYYINGIFLEMHDSMIQDSNISIKVRMQDIHNAYLWFYNKLFGKEFTKPGIFATRANFINYRSMPKKFKKDLDNTVLKAMKASFTHTLFPGWDNINIIGAAEEKDIDAVFISYLRFMIHNLEKKLKMEERQNERKRSTSDIT